MRMLITGGAGYIGTELVYELAASGLCDEILVLDNLCKANYNLFTGLRKIPAANIQFHNVDILDRRSLEKLMSGVDCLIHLAAQVETPLADQTPHSFEQVNNWGSAEVMFAAESAGVTSVIYMSSQGVYGGGVVIGCDHPTSPSNFYGLSKLRGERHLKRLENSTNAMIIRCATTYGYSKNLRFETALNRMIFDAHFSGRIAIHGNPGHTMTYIEVGRVARQLVKVLEGGVMSGTYNLSHRSLSGRDIEGVLRDVYPRLETIYIDQHMQLESLEMRCDDVFSWEDDDTEFMDDVLKFKTEFTF